MPGASNPAATVATPGAIATATPHASPDSQTTGPPPAGRAFGSILLFGGFGVLAIRSTQRRQNERDGDGGETYPRGEFLTPPCRDG